MFFATTLLASSLLTLVNAQSSGLSVLAPGGPNLWWIANSDNNIVWTCGTSPYPTFTVLIANTGNPSLLSSPLAVISVQNNYDCTHTLTKDQVALPAGTGYTVQLADTLNRTHVYAESQPFEIKPMGATYPEASNTPQASGAAAPSTSAGGSSAGSKTGTSSTGSASPAASSTKSNGAVQKGVAAGLLVASVAMGLFML